MKLPAIMFYTGDWLKDPALSKCSPATRGIWTDALCAMHESGRTGSLAGTPDELSRVLRCSPPEVQAAAHELQTTGTADVTIRNGVVTLINRRMKREAKERVQAKLRMERGRRKEDCSVSVTPLLQKCSVPLSVSSSVSSSKIDSKDPPSIEEVKLGAAKIGLAEMEAEKFWHFYESKGWKVGKSPMKVWRSALVNWKLRCQGEYAPPTKPDDDGLAAWK